MFCFLVGAQMAKEIFLSPFFYKPKKTNNDLLRNTDLFGYPLLEARKGKRMMLRKKVKQ